MKTEHRIRQQRDQLIEIVRSFMRCQAPDGTKCAPNDDEFAAAAVALADIVPSAKQKDEEPSWRSPDELEADRARYGAALEYLQSYDLGYLPNGDHSTEWWQDYVRNVVGGIQQIAKNALVDEYVN